MLALRHEGEIGAAGHHDVEASRRERLVRTRSPAEIGTLDLEAVLLENAASRSRPAAARRRSRPESTLRRAMSRRPPPPCRRSWRRPALPQRTAKFKTRMAVPRLGARRGPIILAVVLPCKTECVARDTLPGSRRGAGPESCAGSRLRRGGFAGPGARPRCSRKVRPSYSVRNRPRRRNSGSTSSTKSSSPPGRNGGIRLKPSQPSLRNHSSMWSAICCGEPFTTALPRAPATRSATSPDGQLLLARHVDHVLERALARVRLRQVLRHRVVERIARQVDVAEHHRQDLPRHDRMDQRLAGTRSAPAPPPRCGRRCMLRPGMILTWSGSRP